MATVFTRRVIAYVLDFFVVSAVMWIISYLLYLVISPNSIYSIYQIFPFLVPVLIVAYFAICEMKAGATVGKALMYLQVRSKNGGKITWSQAIVRNLTKIYWIPIIFDWLIGKILKTDRFLNNLTKTIVLDELK